MDGDFPGGQVMLRTGLAHLCEILWWLTCLDRTS